MNDAKRETWFNDLANPAIPLSKLSRNIPHGYVGEKRLEMLFARHVPLLRAVWYIRAIGAIEIVSSPPPGPAELVADDCQLSNTPSRLELGSASGSTLASGRPSSTSSSGSNSQIGRAHV